MEQQSFEKCSRDVRHQGLGEPEGDLTECDPLLPQGQRESWHEPLGSSVTIKITGTVCHFNSVFFFFV